MKCLIIPPEKIMHLIISSEKNEVPHFFFRKQWSTSLFLQKINTHLIISSEKNQAPQYFFSASLLISSEKYEVSQYFFRKTWGASAFLQKKISIFSEEIMRGFIFFWRNNEALGLVTSIILLMLFLQWKNQVPNKKMKHLIIPWEKNKVHHYFFRKNGHLFLKK